MLNTDLSEFIHDATSYAPTNAIILAEASQLAYDSEEKIKQEVGDTWKLSNVEYISKRAQRNLIFSGNADTQAFIAGNDELIIVAFRGTEPNQPEDWKTDFKFKKYPVHLANSDKKVHVHEGFWGALDLVWDELLGHIKTFRDREQTIWFTGHSLGGALATLAGFRLSQSSEFTFNGLYTFGQPRAGKWDFVDYFNKSYKEKVFRFVNNNDFVTFLPPFLFGYAHIGHLYYLTANRQVIKDGLPFSMAVLDRFFGLIDFGKLDHEISTYINIIKENASDGNG